MGRSGRNHILAIALALALLVGAGALLASRVGGVRAQEPPPDARLVELSDGWNLVGWTGPDAARSEAFAQAEAVVALAFTFDAGAQRFDSFRVESPALLNSLTTLRSGDGLWVFASGPTLWEQPVVETARAIPLEQGFNLVIWTGNSGASIAEIVAGLGGALDAIFTYDRDTARFSTFRPSLPPALNTATVLDYGQPLWVLMSSPATWSQPAPDPAVTVAADDGSATLTVPPGSLPPGVAADDIALTRADGAGGPVTFEGDADIAYELAPAGVSFSAPVLLRFSVAMPPEEPAFGALLTAGTLEVVSVVRGAELETGEVGLVAAIPHFSIFSWFGSRGQGATADLTLDKTIVRVGEAVTAEITFTMTDFATIRQVSTTQPLPPPDGPVTTLNWSVTFRPAGPWTWFPSFWNAMGPLVPIFAIAPSPALFFAAGGPRSHSITQSFVCTDPGAFTVTYRDGEIDLGLLIDYTVATKAGEFVKTGNRRGDGFIALSPVSAMGHCVDVHPASFALLDGGTFAPTNSLFGPNGTHVIVEAEPGGLDVRTALPITILATNRDTGEVLQEVDIPPPAEVNCRDATGCSINIGRISVPPGTWVQLVALDAVGNVIAWQDYQA